jgi:hypothetical protein
VVQTVRAQVVARDVYCRIGMMAKDLRVLPCIGNSQWCHLGALKRFKTRGHAAAMRHTTASTMMMCSFHHSLEERHELEIEPLTGQGADGTLRVRWQGLSVLSVPPHPQE